jgi:hypothetical protein
MRFNKEDIFEAVKIILIIINFNIKTIYKLHEKNDF